MTKKPKKWNVKVPKVITKPQQRVLLAVIVVVSAGVLMLAVIAIIVMPYVNPASQRGVGANGFRAFQEHGTTINVDQVVSKDLVKEHLANKAKSVGDVEVSQVFNFDGSRTQTATYPFVRADGAKASVYVDLMLFKNQATMNDAKVTNVTMKAGTIKGNPVYYMHAQTFSSDREYRLMVIKGLKVYKFAVVQPYRKITISEVSSLALLKKLAEDAKF